MSRPKLRLPDVVLFHDGAFSISEPMLPPQMGVGDYGVVLEAKLTWWEKDGSYCEVPTSTPLKNICESCHQSVNVPLLRPYYGP